MARVWQAVDISAEACAADAVELAIDLLEPLGTEIDNLRKKPDEPVTITGFFEADPADADIARAIDNAFAAFGISKDAVTKIERRTVEETDWLAEWKRYWKPTETGRFIISPPWEDPPESDKIVIKIEPNMAFGTGTHETTRLCLRAIGESFRPEMSFLDVGTGTGILSIAAAKLGGTDIFGCDTDVDSVKIARENAELNEVTGVIRFAEGPIGETTAAADFVAANLTIDVIVPILPLLLSKARSFLLLSGILAEQENAIRQELAANGAAEFEVEKDGEWISIVIRTS